MLPGNVRIQARFQLRNIKFKFALSAMTGNREFEKQAPSMEDKQAFNINTQSFWKSHQTVLSSWVRLISSTQFSRNMKIVSKKTNCYAKILRRVSSSDPKVPKLGSQISETSELEWTSISKVSKLTFPKSDLRYMLEEALKFRMMMRVKANRAWGKQLEEEDENSHEPLLLEVCFTYASF